MELGIGWAVFILFLLIVGTMILSAWIDAIDEIKKDAKRKNTIVAKAVADRMFEEYVRTAEYHVYQKPAKLVNESDIDWGGKKEVFL